MTMSLPAFAVEFENKGNNTDIQFKKIMESVYEQLVAQNAEDMYPVYEEIISAQYYNQLALPRCVQRCRTHGSQHYHFIVIELLPRPCYVLFSQNQSSYRI